MQNTNLFVFVALLKRQKRNEKKIVKLAIGLTCSNKRGKNVCNK